MAFEQLVDRHANRVLDGEVDDADPQSPATAGYYAVMHADDPFNYDGDRLNPIQLLEGYGSLGVPNDWIDYWRVEGDSRSALWAMARRGLEQAVANEVQRRNEH